VTALGWRAEAVALRLLSGAEEMGGLEMVKASDGKLSRGFVYVMLTQLEDRGLVESREDGTGTGRRLYRITDAGRARSAEVSS
jgi:DNA-binding PadR family transcriptional regulator